MSGNNKNKNEKENEEKKEKLVGNEKNSDYGKKEYWEERFEEEEEYEWLCKYKDISPFIEPYLKKEDKILVVGCGNSLFSTELYDAGYENVVNIDFSEICIEKMKKNNENRTKMTWLVMDMTNMSKFENEEFDIVIDKATFDALMVAEENVWEPSENCKKQADSFLKETSRVLKQNGYFLSISFAQTHFRTKYLMNEIEQFDTAPYKSLKGYCEKYKWDLTFKSIGGFEGSLDTFFYIMKKSQKM